MQASFEDFRKAIGERFRVKGFTTGLFGKQDLIIKVNEEDQTIEGDFFITHFSNARFISDQPQHLKKISNENGNTVLRAGLFKKTFLKKKFIMETNVNQKTIMQNNGIEITDLAPDFFDTDALHEPAYRLKRIDSKGYRYYAIEQEDGNFIFYISNTSLISATTPTSKFLIDWMISTPNHKEYAKERADYGTLMHIFFGWFMIEKKLVLEDVELRLKTAAELKGINYKDSWTDDLKCDLLAFAAFVHNHNVKPLAIEVSLASGDGYAGTVDLICEMDWEIKGHFGEKYLSGANKGQPKESKTIKRIIAIVDFKSGRKGFYESNEIQLEACRRLCVENFGIEPDMLFNFSPKEWRTIPDYNLKDQTDKMAREKFRHLVEIAKIEKLMDVRALNVFGEEVNYGESITDKEFRKVDLNEYLKEHKAVKEGLRYATA